MTIIKSTPWGKVQTQRDVTEGITWVSTAGHGGLVLSDAKLREMPERYRKLNVYGTGRYFEEDCEWALVVHALPHYFTTQELDAAKDTVRAFYPTLLV